MRLWGIQLCKIIFLASLHFRPHILPSPVNTLCNANIHAGKAFHCLFSNVWEKEPSLLMFHAPSGQSQLILAYQLVYTQCTVHVDILFHICCILIPISWSGFSGDIREGSVYISKAHTVSEQSTHISFLTAAHRWEGDDKQSSFALMKRLDKTWIFKIQHKGSSWFQNFYIAPTRIQY